MYSGYANLQSHQTHKYTNYLGTKFINLGSPSKNFLNIPKNDIIINLDLQPIDYLNNPGNQSQDNTDDPEHIKEIYRLQIRLNDIGETNSFTDLIQWYIKRKIIVSKTPKEITET